MIASRIHPPLAAVACATWYLLGGWHDPCHTMADTVLLRNGVSFAGQLESPEKTGGDQVALVTDSGVRLVLPKQEVTQVIPQKAIERKYADYVERMPDTSQQHWKVYQICKQYGLPAEASFHLNRVLRLEPDNEEARRVAGYIKTKSGDWITREEEFRRTGRVRYNGQWVTRQEASMRASMDHQADRRRQWKRDLIHWRNWLEGRRKDEAIQNFKNIEDPLAAEALGNLLTREEVPLYRRSFIDILGSLPNGAGSYVLLEYALEAPEEDLRLRCLEYFKSNLRNRALAHFNRALKSDDPGRVNAAGFALRELNATESIRPLIGALSVETQHVITTPEQQHTFGTGGSGFSFKRGGKKLLKVNHKNQRVLDALRHITDQNYDFDQDAWMRWYIAANTRRDLDLRYDP